MEQVHRKGNARSMASSDLSGSEIWKPLPGASKLKPPAEVQQHPIPPTAVQRDTQPLTAVPDGEQLPSLLQSMSSKGRSQRKSHSLVDCPSPDHKESLARHQQE